MPVIAFAKISSACWVNLCFNLVIWTKMGLSKKLQSLNSSSSARRRTGTNPGPYRPHNDILQFEGAKTPKKCFHCSPGARQIRASCPNLHAVAQSHSHNPGQKMSCLSDYQYHLCHQNKLGKGNRIRQLWKHQFSSWSHVDDRHREELDFSSLATTDGKTKQNSSAHHSRKGSATVFPNGLNWRKTGANSLDDLEVLI